MLLTLAPLLTVASTAGAMLIVANIAKDVTPFFLTELLAASLRRFSGATNEAARIQEDGIFRENFLFQQKATELSAGTFFFPFPLFHLKKIKGRAGCRILI